MYTYNQIVVDAISALGAKALPPPEIADIYGQCKFRLLYSDFYKTMSHPNRDPSTLTPAWFIEHYAIPETDVCPNDLFSGIGDQTRLYAAVFTGRALPEPLMDNVYKFLSMEKNTIELSHINEVMSKGKDVFVVFGDPYKPMGWRRYADLFEDEVSPSAYLH